MDSEMVKDILKKLERVEENVIFEHFEPYMKKRITMDNLVDMIMTESINIGVSEEKIVRVLEESGLLDDLTRVITR